MILCRLLFVGFLTQTEYTKNPFSAVSLPEVACEFAPTVFSATVLALLKDICTLDSIVYDNVEESCIEPVQFELADPAEGLFFTDLVIVLLLVLPVWFRAFTCCAYVETKIPVIIDAIIDRIATITKFLFLICSIVHLSGITFL